MKPHLRIKQMLTFVKSKIIKDVKIHAYKVLNLKRSQNGKRYVQIFILRPQITISLSFKH